MSEREQKRRRILAAVLREAWRLFRRINVYEWSTVLRLSCAVVRSRIRMHYSKAIGVAASGTSRQERLRQLAQYRAEDISLVLVRHSDNPDAKGRSARFAVG